LERALAAETRVRLSVANAAAVATVCRRLDGLPLALKLAAPWVKLVAQETLVTLLDHRLRLLVDGSRDLPQRQQTMRATLARSCYLLELDQRALLRRLAVLGAPDLTVDWTSSTPINWHLWTNPLGP
jgi:predicted ATPase